MRRLGVTAVLTALPPVLLAGVFPTGGLGALEDDLLYYFPQRTHVGQSFAAGRVPLWNPYVGMGVPLAGDPQVGLWYPPTALFAIMGPFAAYLITLWLHFVLAGGGMYRLARAEGRSRSAALLAGIAFEFGGFLVAHRAHLTILESAAWMPWILLAWGRFGGRGNSRYFVRAALLLGVQMLVQHVQVSMITILLAAGFLLLTFGVRIKLLAAFGLGALLSVALAAIQLIPTTAHFLRCTRSETTFDTLVENSYWPHSVVMLFWPMLFGTRTSNFYQEPYWGPSHWCEQAVYPSLLVMVLALASLRAFRRERTVRTWAVLAAVTAFLAIGRLNPLYAFVYSVPFLNSFRVPARWMLGVAAALPLLAAWTLDRLRSGNAVVEHWMRRTATWGLPAIMAATLAVGWLLNWWGPIAYPTSSGAGGNGHLSFTRPAVYVPIVLGLLTAGLLAGTRRRSVRWLVGVHGLLILDLASVALFVDVDSSTYANRSELIRSPLAEHITAHDRANPGRLWVPRQAADYRRPVEVLWPHLNVLHRVPTLHDYGPLMTRETRALWQFRPWGTSDAALAWLLRPELLEAMGLRWIVARTEAERRFVELARRRWTPASVLAKTEASDSYDLTGPERLVLNLGTVNKALVRVDFRARPLAMGTGVRFVVRLADSDGKELAPPRYFEPADLAFGRRRFRLYFPVEADSTEAKLEMKSFRGKGVSVTDVRCVSMGSEGSSDSEITEPVEIGDVSVSALRRTAPRISFVRRVISVETTAEVLDRLTIESEPATLTETAIMTGFVGEETLPPAEVLDVTAGPNAIQISVDAPQGGVLIIRESYDPGWKAEVDGRPIPVEQANVVCQALRVPPGGRQIRLTYRPVGLVLGAGISVATLFGLLGAGMLSRRRPRLVPPVTQPRDTQSGGGVYNTKRRTRRSAT